jgi:hypothetical protein
MDKIPKSFTTNF